MTKGWGWLVLVVAASVVARPLVAANSVAAGATVRTWAEVRAWLEAEGVHTVTMPSLSGRLKQPFGVGPGAEIFATLDVLAQEEGIHFGVVAADLVVLRPHLKLRTGCPQHLTKTEEAEVAGLRLLASLSDNQWRRLAYAPVPLAELGAESQAPLRALFDTGGVRYPSSNDGMYVVVAYAPWVLISDGVRGLWMPLRRSEDAWYPRLEPRSDAWAYRNVGRTSLARPPMDALLARPLEATDCIRIEREDWTLGELTALLAPDSAVSEEVSGRRLLVPPGEYQTGALLRAVLETTGCVLREFGPVQAVPYFIAEAPGRDPPEPVWAVEERIAQAVSAIARLIAPAYARVLQAETGASIHSIRVSWSAIEPGLREHLTGLLDVYAEMLSHDEAAWLGPALAEASVDVRPGLLVGVAQYDPEGKWRKGNHVLIRPST